MMTSAPELWSPYGVEEGQRQEGLATSRQYGNSLLGVRTAAAAPGACAIRRRRQPLSFKPQSAVKLVASQLSRR